MVCTHLSARGIDKALALIIIVLVKILAVIIANFFTLFKAIIPANLITCTAPNSATNSDHEQYKYY